jgi:hypothetical protein
LLLNIFIIFAGADLIFDWVFLFILSMEDRNLSENRYFSGRIIYEWYYLINEV